MKKRIIAVFIAFLATCTIITFALLAITPSIALLSESNFYANMVGASIFIVSVIGSVVSIAACYYIFTSKNIFIH